MYITIVYATHQGLSASVPDANKWEIRAPGLQVSVSIPRHLDSEIQIRKPEDLAPGAPFRARNSLFPVPLGSGHNLSAGHGDRSDRRIHAGSYGCAQVGRDRPDPYNGDGHRWRLRVPADSTRLLQADGNRCRVRGPCTNWCQATFAQISSQTVDNGVSVEIGANVA
jgi:hypothetical protein